MNIYTHTQTTPSVEWAVKHDLSSIPICDVAVFVDGKLVKILPEAVEYIDKQNVVIRFNSPTTGVARMAGTYVYKA